MVLLGYIGAVLIGLSLGLIGGGGSILTVPVLVYLMDVEPVAATAYSLFIVGLTSAVGGVYKYKEGTVNTNAAIMFGLPAIAAVFLTRKFLVPAMPDIMYSSGALTISKGTFLLILFAVLMLLAAVSMIRSNGKSANADQDKPAHKVNVLLVLLEGSFVGVLTGLVGAGGGFLIIPALVLLRKLPMKTAVGTSLVIIAAKSLFGFIGDLLTREIDWQLLIIFSALAIAGIFFGNRMSAKIHGDKLKKAFGWFVLLMGFYILLKETVFK
ncbi:MAG TPA: sulfite exporter TauE/SafE family protein [Bacteroidia bacterium]|nr:sulfite exporter TauE/SafE family protein [Bacteroidia bacterium]